MVDSGGKHSGFMVVERFGDGTIRTLWSMRACDKVGIDVNKDAIVPSAAFYVVSSIRWPSTTGPHALDIFAISSAISTRRPKYSLLDANCIWYAMTVRQWVCVLFPGGEGPTDNLGPAWCLTQYLVRRVNVDKQDEIEKAFSQSVKKLGRELDMARVKRELEEEPVCTVLYFEIPH
jgi:hypothetical protein